MANNLYSSTANQILRRTTQSYRTVPIRIHTAASSTTTEDILDPSLGNYSSAYNIKCPSISDDFVFGDGDSAFAAVFASVFAILGICLNLLVIVALLYCRRTRRHVTTPFIISLSVSDLVYSAILLPIMAARFHHQETPLDDTWCEIYPLIYYGAMGASLLSLTMVTLNRAFMLFLPAKVDMIFTNYKEVNGRKVPVNSILILFLCWLIPILMLLPSYTGAKGSMGLQKHTQSCTILVDDEGDNPKKLFYAIGFGIPSVTLIVSDIAIFFKMRSMHKSDNRMSIATMDERKMEKLFMLMLGAIFVFFVVTYVPSIIVKGFDPCFKKPTLHVLAYAINWASVWINPIIYVVSQKKYQEAIRKLKDALKRCGPAEKEAKMTLQNLEINSGSKSTEDITIRQQKQERTATNKFVQSLKPTKNTNSLMTVSSGYSSGASNL